MRFASEFTTEQFFDPLRQYRRDDSLNAKDNFPIRLRYWGSLAMRRCLVLRGQNR
jgi:hypothetical protein